MVTRRTMLLSPLLALPIFASLSKKALADSMVKPIRDVRDYSVVTGHEVQWTPAFAVATIRLEPGDVVSRMIGRGQGLPAFCEVTAPGLVKKAGAFVDELLKTEKTNPDGKIELNFYDENDAVWALRSDLDPNDHLIITGTAILRDRRYEVFSRAFQLRLAQYVTPTQWSRGDHTKQLLRQSLAGSVASAVLRVPLKPEE